MCFSVKLFLASLNRWNSLKVKKRMIWPPQSLDLKAIEQIWDHLNSKLKKTNLNKDTLWASLLAEWQTVSEAILTKHEKKMSGCY